MSQVSSRNTGFTLLELMVVMAIVAIIGVIAVLGYQKYIGRAQGVDIPIVPGIMPIAGFSKLARFSDACGADLPRWMRKKFESFGDDTESIRAFGLDLVTELCERLLKGGAPGLHFYCMNQSALTTEICRRLD